MSQNGPKTKSEEVKFFKIDPDGEIKTVHSDQTPPPTEPEPLWNSEVTPVEWQNEPQPIGELQPGGESQSHEASQHGEEPEPLWALDPSAEANEPVNEPSVQLEKTFEAPSLSEEIDPKDAVTQHQHTAWETPAKEVEEPSGLSVIRAEEQESAAVILEEWQEVDLHSIHDSAPVEEEPSHLEPTRTQHAEETEVEVEAEATSAQTSDLTARMQSQMDLLQRQVKTIHGLGPDKKLNDGQIEVFRKYIALKEAESRDLQDQKRQYQTFLQKLDTQIKTFAKKNQQLVLELDSVKVREEASRRDLLLLKDKYKEDIGRLKADFEQRSMQSGHMNTAVADFDRKREEWKTKIREELKHIRLKEKELENKYELLKRDTQALLDSKDSHVLELKRKNDALELEMDNLEDKLRASNTLLSQMDAKKKRLIETLKLAQVLLEQLDKPETPTGSGGSTANGA